MKAMGGAKMACSKLLFKWSMSRTFTSVANSNRCDVVVVGAGIVGCATARELMKRFPKLRVTIVDKECNVAAHQSSHNSGVIHAGIYYAPGSLKAKLCVRGLDLSYKYLDEKKIPYNKCGKLIVAVEPHELSILQELYDRGQKNGVKDMKFVEANEIANYEPYCTGLRAIWSPHTGIVDWAVVTEQFSRDVIEAGGHLQLNFQVDSFHLNDESNRAASVGAAPLSVTSGNREIRCKYVITCGGLFSDRLAQLSGCSAEPKIIPVRGEYLVLKPEKRYLVRGNIYPVPTPGLPFLGVHFTPRMNGDILLGPNAVLAFRREGYGYFQFNPSELLDAISYKGFLKLALKYTAFGMTELYRGIFIKAQVEQLRRFVPQLAYADVERGLTGVRAQALNSSGDLVDDFVFDSGTGDLGQRILHTRNAPSPAATSSMSIAELIADRAVEKFMLH